MAIPLRRHILPRWSKRCLDWVVSGVPSASFGNSLKASISRLSAMPLGLPQILITKRFARVVPGNNEVVLVVFDPKVITYQQLLKVFWESHNPTQGMRQGNDSGTQYRSGIYCYSDSQKQLAEASKAAYQAALEASGYKEITTEILDAPEFYYAEEYHQQYLAKNPGGYCGLGGTNVCMPENLSVPN